MNCARAAVFAPGAAQRSKTFSPGAGPEAETARKEARSWTWNRPFSNCPANCDRDPEMTKTPSNPFTFPNLSDNDFPIDSSPRLPRFRNVFTRTYRGLEGGERMRKALD